MVYPVFHKILKNTHIMGPLKNIEKKHKKKYFLGVLILLTLAFVTLQIILEEIKIPVAKYYELSSKEANSVKTILYWNTFHGDIRMGLGLGEGPFKNCPISNCFATANKSFMPIQEFDAIMFHGARYSIHEDGIPPLRSLHQKYIFMSVEAPFNNYFEKRVNNNFYNWTMTYRKDSDIHYPYGLVQEIHKNYTLPSRKMIKEKKKMAAWFVSQCFTKGSQRRQKYAKELGKHIPLDIYGLCGNLTCPKNSGNYCYEMLEKEYYFYLAFENSQCSDYVTEKLYKTLKYDVVPLVLGYADYSNNAPPRSFINVNDYESPKALARYLIELSENYEEYVQYFEWKKQYEIVTKVNEYSLCQLCELLHQPLEYSSYEDIEDWFYGFKCLL